MTLPMDTQIAWFEKFDQTLKRIAEALEVISDRKTLQVLDPGHPATLTEPVVTDPIAPFDPWAPHAFVPDQNSCDLCGHTPTHPRHQAPPPKPTPIGKDEIPHYGYIKNQAFGTRAHLMICDGIRMVPYESAEGVAVRNVLTEMILATERKVRIDK